MAYADIRRHIADMLIRHTTHTDYAVIAAAFSSRDYTPATFAAITADI